MRQCKWHVGGGIFCGKVPVVARTYGAVVCKEHAEQAEKLWGIVAVKHLRPAPRRARRKASE